MTARRPAILAAALLLAACGSEPTAGGPADPEVEDVAIVRAETSIAARDPSPPAFDRLALRGQVAPLVDRALGEEAGPFARAPRAWVVSLVADGQWRLVFKAEGGPCIVDCAVQRYWYFVVSLEGEPRPAGRYVARAGGAGSARSEGEPRWGFPGEEERRVLAAARAAGGR